MGICLSTRRKILLRYIGVFGFFRHLRRTTQFSRPNYHYNSFVVLHLIGCSTRNKTLLTKEIGVCQSFED